MIVARGMLKPVYFAFETMLEFFCKLHILLNHEHIIFAKPNEQNNRDHDSFETRHFDEGRPCGEPPCTSLVQQSRRLMQKDPCLDTLLQSLVLRGQGSFHRSKMVLWTYLYQHTSNGRTTFPLGQMAGISNVFNALC